MPGSLGETCKVALLLGGRVPAHPPASSTGASPLTFIGSVALLSFVVGRDPLFDVLSGGLILGAFFMATDYVTTPDDPNGKLIFGAGMRAS